MRFLNRIGLLFFVAVISATGLVALAFLAHLIPLNDAVVALDILYNDGYAAMVASLIIAIIILKSLMFQRIILGGQKKERTIAFDNPSGQVSISLTALEDLIRRLSINALGVKEIRPNIIATKKGLRIEIRLILKADVNIPDLTGHLQESIKQKIQDVIGLEENIDISIHVFKIVYDDPKVKKLNKSATESEDKSKDPKVPYQQSF